MPLKGFELICSSLKLHVKILNIEGDTAKNMFLTYLTIFGKLCDI
jgi:hypothetical protein